MRLFYASDVHGSERLWRKFLNAAAFYGADVLIMGGDLTGKVMVPFVERKPGEWVARVFGKDEKAKGEAKLEELERRVRLNGFYPLRCTFDEYERLRVDDGYRDEVFRCLMREELRRWLALAHEKLAGTGVRCYVMPGNDDEWDIDDVLGEAAPPVVSCGERVVHDDGFQILSCAWTNPTPWDSPRELPEPDLLQKLEDLATELEPGKPAIFNLHCPPYDSGLDLAPQLTDDLRVVTEGGEPKLVPVGSQAVRTFIERHQPLVSLHGHIHESRAAARIGSTLCINPGSAYSEGVLDGVVIDIEGGRVTAYQLVSG
ncbi:metallophosphoesterase [Sphaerobacter sp.]|uniref:metallophosphoesterase n=1 Tax=Sphaerobacter sp. TaxID=2099654 RepID=UPI001D3762D1|nr:metallophosphoesterase [Sphaerobacter sp.]MBX5443572.1 metallophosphoesterase [Sphaerobacter sp.]